MYNDDVIICDKYTASSKCAHVSTFLKVDCSLDGVEDSNTWCWSQM